MMEPVCGAKIEPRIVNSVRNDSRGRGRNQAAAYVFPPFSFVILEGGEKEWCTDLCGVAGSSRATSLTIRTMIPARPARNTLRR